MGTSLSGLTPATTFDGLLKVGDNDPLTATLKPISTGDGTDTMLELSTSALQIGGATGMYWDNTNKRLGLNDVTPTSKIDIKNTFGASALSQLDRMGLFVGYTSASFGIALGGASSYTSGLVQGTNNIGNASGTLSLNPFGSDVGVGSVSPTAKLHIKGSGATSATTSLLVQNSAGTNIFKVVDDNTMFYHTHKFRSAGGYLYIEGEGNADRSLKVGQNFTASSYDGHIFKTYDGVAYSEAMRITGANDQFIGIGETTPTAKLHVKAGTTQDSIAKFEDPRATTDYIEIKNDSTLTDYTGLYWGTSVKIRSKQTGAIFLDCTSGILFANGNSSKNKIDGEGNMSIGTPTIPASTRLTIKGQGATSATTALLVENSSGTDTLEVRDDGRVVAGTGATTNANGTFNVLHGVSNLTTRVFTVSRDSVLRGMDINSGGSTKISDSSGDQSFSHTATAVLEVSSTTQGFLPPRMTGTQRDAIEAAAGLIIYNTTTNKAQCYNGTSWNDMF